MKLGSHPLNLGLRFILELTALISIGYWGYQSQPNFYSYILMIILPVIAATVWGVFAVPNDPSRSGKTVVKVSGIIRLIIEFIVFGAGALAIYYSGYQTTAAYYLGLVLFHYLISIDRITWLFKQK
ncbi:MAG: YrdB family protein [Flavobacteriales bacterium]|nr:YrdB family protein [Flavobacteriales bacterium]